METPSERTTHAIIKSKDINRDLFSLENLNVLRTLFPSLSDDTLARYLIARNNDLAKSTELLTKAMAWRATHWPVLKQDCINQINKGVMYQHGYDKEGRPLLILRAKFHNPSERSIEELAKTVIWWTEQVLAKLPNDKTKYTILIDRSDAGLNNQDIEFSRHFSKLFQDQHPERLYRAIVYPSGLIFWSLWNVVKWFLDPVTRDKVTPVMYFSGVQEYIDDEYIPVSMGGKCSYEFNSDDYLDPYPEELIQETLARREARTTQPASFFTPDEAASGNYESS